MRREVLALQRSPRADESKQVVLELRQPGSSVRVVPILPLVAERQANVEQLDETDVSVRLGAQALENLKKLGAA